ncbi:ImpA family type VI secretion system protein [Pantoea sp.]|uniref:type VI secretion system protein TssA n=1 Tax=Pantoea sp. TaxID=69393 RepID=UPI0028A11609|nr:type VI secretion system ImpA family N-terminal domain-containing protein [Pantoea sp.]
MQKTEYYGAVLLPFPGDAPCGGSLDYDANFLLLQSRLQPRQEVEYGNFTESPEPLNWREIESECLKLIGQSKDIRLIIALMRCRLRQVGLIAVEEGLSTLLHLLTHFPDDLHPQLFDEGEFEPVIRANALAELENSQGFLADLRQKNLPRALGMQVTVKALEKAKQTTQQEENDITDAQVAAMLEEWQKRNDQEIIALQRAGSCLKELKNVLAKMLGEQAPAFLVLEKILKIFASGEAPQFIKVEPAMHINSEPLLQTDIEPEQYCAEETEHAGETYSAVEDTAHIIPEHNTPSQPQIALAQPIRPLLTRDDALSRLEEVRTWFVNKEPSSPVVLLLEFTERMIGMRFTELVKHLPPEMIARLEGNDQEKTEE